MYRSCALAFMLLITAPPLALRAQGNGGTLVGTIVDRSGRPIESVTVLVTPVGGTAPTATTRTDAAGRFRLVELAAGEYQLLVRRVGFVPAQTLVTITAGTSVSVELALASSAAVLDTVRSRVSQHSCNNRTVQGFECRRQAGVGYFRDAQELAALKPIHLHDLFRDLPGIRQGMGRGPGGLRGFVPNVRPSRCLRTLVNGRPPFGGQWWTAKDVIGIEYYDSWQKVPVDFRQIADLGSCDLIVYWLSNALVDDRRDPH